MTGKFTLFAAAVDAGYAWLAVVNSVVSLYYYARVLGPAYFEAPARPSPVLGQATAVATVIAAASVVVAGVVAEPLLDAFMTAALLP